VPDVYWAPESRCPTGPGVVAFSTDDKPQFAYDAFVVGRDFGPLDLARTVMYCRWVDAQCAAHVGYSALVHVTSDSNAELRANTVALCGAYLVLVRGHTAEDAFRPFAKEPLPPFLDCRGGPPPGAEVTDEDEAEFGLLVLDALRGLERAVRLGWLEYRTFDVEEHSSMLHSERGDMSWLLPGKVLALASPWASPRDNEGLPVCTPAALVPFFKQHRIEVIVQCNDPAREEEGERRHLLCYQPKQFEAAGVRHVALPFEDGGCPSGDLLLHFVKIAEETNGAVAVHCRSGLGRTATLIGALAMMRYGFSARSFIGWARISRPGTVHGSQQQYLVNLEQHLRPGCQRPLRILPERERLKLLPRRELRFWAVDHGIQADFTRRKSEEEIIDMILEVQRQQGQHQELPAPVPTPPSVNIAGFGQESGRTASSMAGPSSGRSAGDSARDGLQRNGSDEWDEVLRYISLLTTTPENNVGETMWEGVRHLIEQLRSEQVRGTPSAHAMTTSAANGDEEALRQAHKDLEKVVRERELRDGQLQQLRQEASEQIQRADQLRAQISQAREEKLRAGIRLEDHEKAIAAEGSERDARVARAEQELDAARAIEGTQSQKREAEKLISETAEAGQGNGEGIMTRAQLRTEIAAARAELAHYEALCGELKAQRAGAEARQMQVRSQPVRPDAVISSNPLVRAR